MSSLCGRWDEGIFSRYEIWKNFRMCRDNHIKKIGLKVDGTENIVVY